MEKHLSGKPCKVVVLGSNGFLGAAMTRHLAKAGHNVTCYCRTPNFLAEEYKNVKSIIADLRDTWTLAEAITDADVVYQFASATHPSLFFSNPSAEYWEALQPLLVLMETAARVGVKKIVFPSSGGTVYANGDLPRTEASLTEPRSPYAIMKLAGEALLHHSARLGQFSVDVFRIGNPYGPGQRPRPGQGVLPHWIDAILNNQTIKIFGDGSAQRDYVYIDDLCHMMAISLDRLNDSGTFNAGSGSPTSLEELVAVIRSLVPTSLDIAYLPERPSDIHSIVLETDRLLSLMPGFQLTSLVDGVRKTLNNANIGTL